MSQITFAAKAAKAWGENLPDWVEELASLADQTNLKGAGDRIGYSYGAISAVFSKTYKGDLNAIEDAVRGALMGLNVNCPAQGEIGRDQCLRWQRKPRITSDPTSVRVYRACRSGCPHSRLKIKPKVNVKEY